MWSSDNPSDQILTNFVPFPERTDWQKRIQPGLKTRQNKAGQAASKATGY